jgi:hypothetical protein
MRLDVGESSMQVNIDDPIEDPHEDSLTGPLTGQAAMRRLRGKVRWEGNLDESRLGRPFEQHEQVAHP